MKFHPEMRELINEAMREGLSHTRRDTPAQILARVRKKMLDEQNWLRPNGRIIVAHTVRGCKCLDVLVSHVPWCEAKDEIVIELQDPNPYLSDNFYYPYIDPKRRTI